MTPIIVALSLAILVILAMRAGLAIIRRYENRYESYAAAANEFYTAADRLIDNPNTPDDVLKFVGEMNESINFPHTALIFAQAMQRRRRIKNDRAARFDLRTMPQDIVADFVLAFGNWIDAISYRGMIFGPIFRAYLDAPSVERETAAVARKIQHKQALAAAA